MGHIIPKLNLNKTPQAVDSNSLVFAKNIKVNIDGSLGRDNSIVKVVANGREVDLSKITGNVIGRTTRYLGHIVGVNSCIYFFMELTDVNSQYVLLTSEPSDWEENYTNYYTYNDNVYSRVQPVVGDSVLLFAQNTYYKLVTTTNVFYKIYEYNEVTTGLMLVPCNWTYNGGHITGCVTINNTNQKVLTVSEYFDDTIDSVLVPLKHINLSECKPNDDESIYTQNPNIPITNLHFAGYYNCTIPNGVYQFFVRYKVRDGFYTNWFPASKELYAGVANEITTIQGSLRYVDTQRDCPRSFIFNVEHLQERYCRNYEKFQIGFIVSSGNAVVGRTWKEFSIHTNVVYFDYDKQFIEEELVDEFIKTPYEIYNAKNVINYKNKLYISNYIESDLNKDLSKYNSDITIDTEFVDIESEYTSVVKTLNNAVLKENITYHYYDKITLDNDDKDINNIFLNTDFVNIHFNRFKQNKYNTPRYNFDDTAETITIYRHYPKREKFKPDSTLLSNYKTYLNIDFEDYYLESITLNLIDSNNENLTKTISLTQDLKDKLEELESKDGVTGKTFYDSLFTFLNGLSNNKKFSNTLELTDIVRRACEYHVKSNIVGLSKDSDGCFYINITENNVTTAYKIDDITVSLLNLNLTSTTIYPQSGLNPFVVDYYNHSLEFKPYIVDVKLGLHAKEIIDSSSIVYNNLQQVNTLMPYTTYNFYVHYVAPNGITTNGYYIGSKYVNIDSQDVDYTAKAIIPTFSQITIPTGYSAYFISIAKVENDIINVIPQENKVHHAIELDSLLYSEEGWNTLKTPMHSVGVLPLPEIGEEVVYHGSNDSDNNYFGQVGVLITTTTNTYKFIRKQYSINTDNIQLIKLTPYSVDCFDKIDLNSPAFISKVTKLDYEVCADIFCSGYDVFSIDRSATVKITEYNQPAYLHHTSINYGSTNKEYFFIYSNFNLNCLSLRENLNKGIRMYSKEVEVDNGENESETTEIDTQEYIVSANSQNCSLIYDLPLMYKEYTRKYYSVVDDKTFTVFDNTVRSSNVDVDEVFRSIYKFDAEDYYNVPTNRGIIVNLFSINNEIFVHTEHGLFKFTDSSLLKVGDNLYSSNKEVGVSESSPFEIGIAEIVDSQYGHGGLQNKEHALITFNGYIFYDSLVRNIYSYDNQSGIQNITPPVRKIIDWFEPTDVTFVSDDANNRFFITLSKVVDDTKQVICLSYSFISKSFVSIHDIDYTHAFNSRLNTYFIQGSNFLKVNYKDFGSYVNKYPSVLTIMDEAAYNENSVGSCIDIIINDGYEVIKYLSHIHWICSSINNYVGENPYNVAEELIAEYGGDSIRVYSDQTWSDLLPIDTEQNTQQINSANSYQYPRYNNGIWTMNYFRDIKNANSNYISDEMSLIHGKYIVVRFIFGANKKNFKFENLNINFKNYEKV